MTDMDELVDWTPRGIRLLTSTTPTVRDALLVPVRED
jgi:hypothetical protein